MMKKTREESLKKKKNTDGGTFINLKCGWDFPGPVVGNPASNAEDVGSIPGQGTKPASHNQEPTQQIDKCPLIAAWN